MIKAVLIFLLALSLSSCNPIKEYPLTLKYKESRQYQSKDESASKGPIIYLPIEIKNSLKNLKAMINTEEYLVELKFDYPDSNWINIDDTMERAIYNANFIINLKDKNGTTLETIETVPFAPKKCFDFFNDESIMKKRYYKIIKSMFDKLGLFLIKESNNTAKFAIKPSNIQYISQIEVIVDAYTETYSGKHRLANRSNFGKCQKKD